MIDIRNVATTGFDRAIIAMRRDHGGREVSDSEWIADADDGLCLFEIGEADRAECLHMIKRGDYDFLKYVAIWAHVEAPAEWWAVYGGYFIAQGDVVRKGANVTRSIMTTYANMRNLIETAHENATGSPEEWKAWTALRDAVEKGLPESWALLDGLEV